VQLAYDVRWPTCTSNCYNGVRLFVPLACWAAFTRATCLSATRNTLAGTEDFQFVDCRCKATRRLFLSCRQKTRRLTGDSRTTQLYVSFHTGDCLHGDFKRIHVNCLKAFVFSGEGPRSRRYGRTAALRLIVQPYDDDDDDDDDDYFLSFS
jgi:hypothetical protein